MRCCRFRIIGLEEPSTASIADLGLISEEGREQQQILDPAKGDALKKPYPRNIPSSRGPVLSHHR
jgi:hypothetical protein